MTVKTWERRSLQLTPDEWTALERIAAETASAAPAGPTAGQPSWRTLIKRIADGDLDVTPTARTK